MPDNGGPARRLLVVWWSNTGGTEALVAAACDGARESVREDAGVMPADPERTDASVGDTRFDTIALRCDRATPQALLRADALLFATPECLGTMAGPMKAFFDRCYYSLLDRMVGRPYATLVCAGSDGQGAARQIERIATGWRLRRVMEPMVSITGAQSPQAIAAPKTIDPRERARASTLGATLAAGTAAGIW